MNDGVPSTQKLSWCLFQRITYICSPVLLLPPQKAIWHTHGWMFALIRLQPRTFPLSKQFISKSVKLRACYQRQLSHPSSYLPSWNRHHVVCCRRNGILKERFDIKKLKLQHWVPSLAILNEITWASILVKQRGIRFLSLGGISLQHMLRGYSLQQNNLRGSFSQPNIK